MTRTACPRTAPHGWFGCVTVVLCVAGRKCRKRRHGDGTLRSLRNELQGRRDCSLADKAQPHALVASLKDSLGDGSGGGLVPRLEIVLQCTVWHRLWEIPPAV